MPLRPDSFYAENGIDLRLNADVTGIDARSREVALADGSKVPYDRLLLATGAEPVRLSIPGADQPHVLTLRSLADCRAIIERAKTARRAVVMGASFIGLEVAASLRARDIEVHVVAPEKRPMERILGPQMGDFVRVAARGARRRLPSRGHGERHRRQAGEAQERRRRSRRTSSSPASACARGSSSPKAAGLAIDRGVVVDAYLETSAPGIFAAGDIARWPDPHSGESIRVEHWVVAERQGQTAALNMLGHREKFTAVPFFWSQHYDVPINYVGHAERWDELDDRRRHRGQGLPAALQAQWAHARRRLDLPRRRKPPGRGGDGAASGIGRSIHRSAQQDVWRTQERSEDGFCRHGSGFCRPPDR